MYRMLYNILKRRIEFELVKNRPRQRDTTINTSVAAILEELRLPASGCSAHA